MANCPFCGRHLGTFTNDPLLATPSLGSDDYKGFVRLISTHIIELQTERHQQEIDNGVTPLTTFSPVNDTGLFQNIKQYITELRDSTEKIIAITGMSLAEFLSTDEDGNPMTPKSDWSDTNLEENKFQCKAIHIEDLRHFIGTSSLWDENWSVMKDYEVYIDGIPGGFIPKIWDNNRFTFTPEALIWQGDKQSSYPVAIGWKNNNSYYLPLNPPSGTFTVTNDRWYVALLDSHIKSFARYTIDVPQQVYPLHPIEIFGIANAAQWSFTHSGIIENPNIFLMQSSNLLTRKLITSLNAIATSTIYHDAEALVTNTGYVRLKLRFNSVDKFGFGAIRNIYFYLPLGTYVPINDFANYYVLGVNNINTNLTTLFQTAFPTDIDPLTTSYVQLQTITCEYLFNFDINLSFIFPIRTMAAMGIDVDIQMDVDEIKFTT
jgi:hypothetical protein